MAPRFLKYPGLCHHVAHITTISINGGVLHQAMYTQKKMQITLQYLDYLTPVDESDIPDVPMAVYNQLLGPPSFPK